MPAGFTWDDTEAIALELYERHPDTDPLTVRFTDLHKWITGLENFADAVCGIQILSLRPEVGRDIRQDTRACASLA